MDFHAISWEFMAIFGFLRVFGTMPRLCSMVVLACSPVDKSVA
jgi:hypothetical protein